MSWRGKAIRGKGDDERQRGRERRKGRVGNSYVSKKLQLTNTPSGVTEATLTQSLKKTLVFPLIRLHEQ